MSSRRRAPFSPGLPSGTEDPNLVPEQPWRATYGKYRLHFSCFMMRARRHGRLLPKCYHLPRPGCSSTGLSYSSPLRGCGITGLFPEDPGRAAFGEHRLNFHPLGCRHGWRHGRLPRKYPNGAGLPSRRHAIVVPPGRVGQLAATSTGVA